LGKEKKNCLGFPEGTKKYERYKELQEEVDKKLDDDDNNNGVQSQ